MSPSTKEKIIVVGVCLGALLGALAFLGLLFGVGGHSFGLAVSPTGNVVNNPDWYTNGFYAGSQQQFAVDASGNLTVSGNVSNTGTVTVGANGTPLNHVVAGACKVIAYSNTIAASTTGTVDCGSTGAVGGTLTGVVIGDYFDAYATTTISCNTQGCVNIVASYASSTNGYGRLILYNGTGGTFTWTGTASTSITYQDLH